MSWDRCSLLPARGQEAEGQLRLSRPRPPLLEAGNVLSLLLRRGAVGTQIWGKCTMYLLLYASQTCCWSFGGCHLACLLTTVRMLLLCLLISQGMLFLDPTLLSTSVLLLSSASHKDWALCEHSAQGPKIPFWLFSCFRSHNLRDSGCSPFVLGSCLMVLFLLSLAYAHFPTWV